MKLDAYAGNVYGGASPEEVATMAAWGTGCRVDRGKPMRRYHDVYQVLDGADMVGWVGRDHVLDSAYFELKGQSTPGTAAAIRKHWPESHGVSRADPAEDYDEPGAYEQLRSLVDGACDPRVKSWHVEPRQAMDGRTTYWGSPQSRVLVRVYEAGKHPDRVKFGRPNWVRAELQYRPGKAAEKRLAAYMTPLDMWGAAAWSKRAAEALCQVEVPRFAPQSQPAEFDRTTLYLARSYRKHWEQMLADMGDWECVGRELAAVWQADDLAAAAADAVRSSN